MPPPNTDAIIQEIEKLNLQTLARTKGHYLVYPDTKVCIGWVLIIVFV
jgi:sulfonate dioxygenase